MQTAAAELYLKRVCMWPTTFYRQQHWRARFRCHATSQMISMLCVSFQVCFSAQHAQPPAQSLRGIHSRSAQVDGLADVSVESFACSIMWWAVEINLWFNGGGSAHARCTHTSFGGYTMQYSLGLFLQPNWLLQGHFNSWSSTLFCSMLQAVLSCALAVAAPCVHCGCFQLCPQAY